MKKLSFTFDKELFGAFQHGDWKKEAEVEDEINDFLKKIKTIYVGNGVNIASYTGIFFASFDTQHHDERAKSSRRRFFIVIDPGNKLTFEEEVPECAFINLY